MRSSGRDWTVLRTGPCHVIVGFASKRNLIGDQEAAKLCALPVEFISTECLKIRDVYHFSAQVSTMARSAFVMRKCVAAWPRIQFIHSAIHSNTTGVIFRGHACCAESGTGSRSLDNDRPATGCVALVYDVSTFHRWNERHPCNKFPHSAAIPRK